MCWQRNSELCNWGKNLNIFCLLFYLHRPLRVLPSHPVLWTFDASIVQHGAGFLAYLINKEGNISFCVNSTIKLFVIPVAL